METRLFIYGTLMSAEVMAAVIGRAPIVQPARLPHFVRRSIRGMPCPLELLFSTHMASMQTLAPRAGGVCTRPR